MPFWHILHTLALAFSRWQCRKLEAIFRLCWMIFRWDNRIYFVQYIHCPMWCKPMCTFTPIERINNNNSNNKINCAANYNLKINCASRAPRRVFGERMNGMRWGVSEGGGHVSHESTSTSTSNRYGLVWRHVALNGTCEHVCVCALERESERQRQTECVGRMVFRQFELSSLQSIYVATGLNT